jgi:hypothetical protein
MIEADLVSAGNNGETVEQTRAGRPVEDGGEKREKEGKGRIYNDDKWTCTSPSPRLCLPHYTSPRHFSLSFSLRGIHTYYPGS